MGRIRSNYPLGKRLALRAAAATLGWVWAVAAHGQVTTRRGGPDAGGPFPKLPGAVTRAPEGLGKIPFNLQRYFAAPPRDQNAAPLYLDAFFEFDNALTSSFPEGAERDRRHQATMERSKRFQNLEDAVFRDPKSVSAAAIDDVIKLYDIGFKKLADAQRRERCVFECGVGSAALRPHFQAGRLVSRVASLRIRRDLEKRDIDSAIRDVESELRLARDLQPRGGVITQAVNAAIIQLVCIQIRDILAAPAVRVEHCDRLIKLLTQYEAKSTDGYGEMLRATYVDTRVTLRDLVRHQPELAQQFAVKRGGSVVRAVAEAIFERPLPAGEKLFPADADVLIARTTNAEMARKIRDLDRYYSALLRLEGIPYADRIVKIAALKLAPGDDVLFRVFLVLTPSFENYARGLARATASVRATECLVALRRWQLRQHGAPSDMASAIRGSALKAVPTDPYDGKPLRLALVDSQPIVYAVGSDGQDDGGQKDSDRDSRPTGDVIYRLSPPPARR